MITANLHLYKTEAGATSETTITATLYFYKSEQRGSALTITLATGLRGAVGPQGPPGSGLDVLTAAENLGGHRAITARGLHCDPSTADELVGITIGAAMLGSLATYVAKGPLEEPSWSWTPSAPIFLGAAGVLTQTPLTSGPVRRIAWAVTPTQINVDFSPSIIQA